MITSTSEFLQTIESDYEVVLQHGTTERIDLPDQIEAAAFFSRERTEELYRSAQLVISHCGIGSIFNSLKYNRPTLIFTRLEKYGEFSDNHQLQIAREIKINPLLFVHEEGADNQKDAFVDFYRRSADVDNDMRDLINYELADRIADELYS